MSEKASWQTPIREGCFMVGHRDAESLLQCNTYLRSFKSGSSRVHHWCIDPGSRLDYEHVKDHLLEHVGELSALRMFSINHQDPDVVGNLIALTSANDHLAGLATQDVWRLVRHLDVKPRHLYFADQAHDNLVRVPGGHQIRVVPTPFCHFRGAMAFYDPESRILFSGDLFGGLNVPGRVQLYGEPADWAGIAQFHQIYMPTRAAVAHAIKQVRALRPAVEVIAPQHGFVLAGDFMDEVLDRLEKLPVGLDLLEIVDTDGTLEGYRAVVADFVHALSLQVGRFEILERLRNLSEDHELRRYVHVSGREVLLDAQGTRALPLLVEELTRDLPRSLQGTLKGQVLAGCMDRSLPLPQLGVGVQETGSREDLN